MIKKVVRLLEDSQWYSLVEIRNNCSLCDDDLQRVLDFLRCFQFVVVDEKAKRARLEECILKLPV